jgi:hypothetical protein
MLQPGQDLIVMRKSHRQYFTRIASNASISTTILCNHPESHP